MADSLSRLTQKRLHGEMKLLEKDPLDMIEAVPNEKNIFEWHFLIRGLDTPYKEGYYIGKLLIPHEYPNKAPDFMMLTPSGRFEPGKKICLSNTGYHPESWSPMWNIRGFLLGCTSIMLEDKHESQGLAALTETKEERIKLAKSSVAFNLKHYKEIFCQFSRFVNSDGSLIPEEKIKEDYEKLHPQKKEDPKKTQVPDPKKTIISEKIPDKKVDTKNNTFDSQKNVDLDLILNKCETDLLKEKESNDTINSEYQQILHDFKKL